MDRNILTFETRDELHNKLCEQVCWLAERSIKLNGSFNLVLTGGESILPTYSLLQEKNINWEKCLIFLTDERVTLDLKLRNDQKIYDSLLGGINIPENNIMFFRRTEDVIQIEKHIKKRISGVNFDLVILSMGEDGHVASLFPMKKHPFNQEIVFEDRSPKPPSKRVSMSYDLLSNTEFMFKVVIGRKKVEKLNKILRDSSMPVNKVNAKNETYFVCKE